MKSAKRPLTLGDFVVVSAFLVIVAVVGFPILSLCTYRATPKNAVIVKLKQIGTALMIYADENDGSLPTAYTSSTFQAALEPYMKSEYFLPVKESSTAPTFNYNLVGLNIYSDIVPLGQTKPSEPSEIPMVYSLLLNPKLNSPAVICYADSCTKAWPATKPFSPANLFATQFEREQKSK